MLTSLARFQVAGPIGWVRWFQDGLHCRLPSRRRLERHPTLLAEGVAVVRSLLAR